MVAGYVYLIILGPFTAGFMGRSCATRSRKFFLPVKHATRKHSPLKLIGTKSRPTAPRARVCAAFVRGAVQEFCPTSQTTRKHILLKRIGTKSHPTAPRARVGGCAAAAAAGRPPYLFSLWAQRSKSKKTEHLNGSIPY